MLLKLLSCSGVAKDGGTSGWHWCYGMYSNMYIIWIATNQAMMLIMMSAVYSNKSRQEVCTCWWWWLHVLKFTDYG